MRKKRRVCRRVGCQTILSIYNPSNRCSLHEHDVMSEKFTGNIHGAYRLSREERRRLQRGDVLKGTEMNRGRWVPFAAIIVTAVLMLVIFAFMANRAYAATTYPPPPPTTPPPSTPTAHTGFEGQHDALAVVALSGVGVIVLGAAAIGRRRAKEFVS